MPSAVVRKPGTHPDIELDIFVSHRLDVKPDGRDRCDRLIELEFVQDSWTVQLLNRSFVVGATGIQLLPVHFFLRIYIQPESRPTLLQRLATVLPIVSYP
jgi:hypothetical protein